MASIYKPKGRTRYHISYTDAKGARRSVAGFRDKEATKAKARQIERDIERARAGIPTAQAKQHKVADAISAYLKELERIGRSTAHRYNEDGFLRRLQKALQWSTLADIRPDAITQHLAVLHQQDKSPRTINAYLSAAKAFCQFCVRQKWLSENPLATVAKARIGDNKPRRRRAFTRDELHRLTTVHPDRGTIYLIAALSGNRREELAQLQPRDCRLDNNPQWKMRAEITKPKRCDIVSMLPECAELMREIVKGKEQTEPIFGPMPIPRTFNKDLQRAGIDKRDELGRQVDFHSLRYTFCTLCGSILPIQVVKVLMRHRDIRTTCNLYLDLGMEDITDAIQSLPRILKPEPPKQ